MEGELDVVGSHATWRNYVRDVHEEGWREEVVRKSSLNWYKLDKEGFGHERNVKGFSRNGEVRSKFRLRTQQDSFKKKCGMSQGELCVERSFLVVR